MKIEECVFLDDIRKLFIDYRTWQKNVAKFFCQIFDYKFDIALIAEEYYILQMYWI